MNREDFSKQMHCLVDASISIQREGQAFLSVFVEMYLKWLSEELRTDDISYKPSFDSLMKIWEAECAGWTFCNWEKAPYSGGRHSVWVSSPEEERAGLHQCFKADSKREDWVEALLEEIDLPK